MSARTTRHATKRTRERLGLQKKSVERNTEKALEFGISHKEATGNLRKYMDGLYLSNKKATNMRIYHEHTYIFLWTDSHHRFALAQQPEGVGP